MEQIQIIRIGLAELEELQSIGKQTFHETFAEINTPENMEKYLDDSFNAIQLTGELQNPDSEFYFATIGNKAIGYLKLNFGAAQTEIKDLKSMEIERIYVLKEFHRQKVGQKLYDKAIQVAREAKLVKVWLGVWENNQKALSFYRKNGFVQFSKHIFRLGNDEQTDIMMQLQIS